MKTTTNNGSTIKVTKLDERKNLDSGIIADVEFDNTKIDDIKALYYAEHLLGLAELPDVIVILSAAEQKVHRHGSVTKITAKFERFTKN